MIFSWLMWMKMSAGPRVLQLDIKCECDIHQDDQEETWSPDPDSVGRYNSHYSTVWNKFHQLISRAKYRQTDIFRYGIWTIEAVLGDCVGSGCVYLHWCSRSSSLLRFIQSLKYMLRKINHFFTEWLFCQARIPIPSTGQSTVPRPFRNMKVQFWTHGFFQ